MDQVKHKVKQVAQLILKRLREMPFVRGKMSKYQIYKDFERWTILHLD